MKIYLQDIQGILCLQYQLDVIGLSTLTVLISIEYIKAAISNKILYFVQVCDGTWEYISESINMSVCLFVCLFVNESASCAFVHSFSIFLFLYCCINQLVRLRCNDEDIQTLPFQSKRSKYRSVCFQMLVNENNIIVI